MNKFGTIRMGNVSLSGNSISISGDRITFTEADGSVVTKSLSNIRRDQTIDEWDGNVIIHGNVSEASVRGGILQIEGNVNGDVSVAGGSISIKGDVSGDVSANGGSISIGRVKHI